MKHVVSFSGGKDSTAMLLMMIEKGMQIDAIINVDTTKEFPQMYEHIKKVKEYIKPLEIITVKIDFDYWMFEHIKTKGKNKGKKGYGWPDFRNRWCTALKRDAIRPYEKAISYHGIAYNEKNRTTKNTNRNIRYPLVEWGITEQAALDYCYKHGFDWGGLYEKFQRVSCWCCPLSRIGELRTLYFKFPELWKQLQEMDKKAFNKFRPDWTVDELTRKFHQHPLLGLTISEKPLDKPNTI